MTKRVSLRCVVVSAVSIAAFAAASQASAQNVGASVLDGACVALKEKYKVGGSTTGSEVGDVVVGAGASVFRDVVKSRSVICQIDDPGVMLATTTDFVNRTALHSAKGLSSVENALGMKNTMAVYIANLEKALQGGNPQLQINSERVKVVKTIGDRAKQIQAELEKRKGQGYLSPEALQHVIDAQAELAKASYYLTQSAAGASSFGLMFSKMSAEEKLRFTLPQKLEDKAVSESFLISAPQRIIGMTGNLRGVVRLDGKISDSLSTKEIDETRKAISKAQKKGRKQAKSEAKQIKNEFEDQLDDDPFASSSTSATKTAATKCTSKDKDNDSGAFKKLGGGLKSLGNNAKKLVGEGEDQADC